MKMMEARDVLIQEATGLLADMEMALVDIEGNGAANKRIDDIFHAVRTIKGSSGLFGLNLIVNFIHEMENLLVRVRNNDLIINAELTLLLLGCIDYVGRMINTLSNHELQDPDPGLRKKLLRNLREFDAPDFPGQIPNAINTRLVPPTLWQIGRTFSPDILRQGMNPTSFIDYLRGMGDIKAITFHSKNLPTIEPQDTEQAYLHVSIHLRSRARQHELEQALSILLNDNKISVAPVNDLAEITADTNTENACSIIDGFHIAVGKAHFVVPVDAVVECVDLPELDESTCSIHWRGTLLNCIHLANEFSLDPEIESIESNAQHPRQRLLVLQCGDRRAGVLVNKCVGELQAVVKPLSPFLRDIKAFTGSTILNDGTLALILDVAALLQRSCNIEPFPHSRLVEKVLTSREEMNWLIKLGSPIVSVKGR